MTTGGPVTPAAKAAAFGTVATGTMFGGWVAEFASHTTGYKVIGALAGYWFSVRLWNRWVARGS